MPAKENTLGTLHETVAQKYIDMLKDPEECTPALLSSAIKFLKDNGITCEAGDGQMDDLSKKAAEVLKFPYVVGEE